MALPEGGRITGVCPADGGATTPPGSGVVSPGSGSGCTVPPGGTMLSPRGCVVVVSPPAPGGVVGGPGRMISGSVAGPPGVCARTAGTASSAAPASAAHHNRAGLPRRRAAARARLRCVMP